MKTILRSVFSFLCLLVLLGGSIGLEAKCRCGKPKKRAPTAVEKIYVDPSDVQIAENVITVDVEGEVLIAPALFTDQEGPYILVQRRQGRCPEGFWECGTCQCCNYWNAMKCEYCGYW